MVLNSIPLTMEECSTDLQLRHLVRLESRSIALLVLLSLRPYRVVEKEQLSCHLHNPKRRSPRQEKGLRSRYLAAAYRPCGAKSTWSINSVSKSRGKTHF